MSLGRALAIVLRQYYLVRGSLSRVVPLFVWVAIDVVLWGFITRYLDRLGLGRAPLVPTLLGAALLWDFLVRVMQGVTMAFLEDVWARNFLNLFATPIRISEYLTGLVISSTLSSAIGLTVMLLVAIAGFGLSFAPLGLTLAAFLGVLFLFGIALGILGTALVLRLGPAAEWFIWPIPAALSPFAAVFYPLATLPAWMQWIARVMPAAWVFEGLRSALAGHGLPLRSLAVGGGLAVLDVVLACAIFAAVYRYTVRTGLIARYSAETVT
ncbi:MAG: ABC transporter permease [Candidatus Eisenbacteria bacterium]